MNALPKDLARLGCITSCPNHRPNRAVKALVAICVSAICTGLLSPPVRADVPMSKYIVLYLEQDGKPYDKPVGVYLASSAILDVSAVPPSSDLLLPPWYADYSETSVFLILLLLTLLIEVPILLAMVRYAFGLWTIGWPKLLVTGVLASALTLPCLWLFMARADFGAPYALVVGEILVFLVEAGIYALVLKISIRRALLISFVANLASLALGLVLF